MIRAIAFRERQAHRDAAVAGSVWFSAVGDGGRQAMWFFCPCGCGDLARIEIGTGCKPSGNTPSWNWNGRTDAVTLAPSVHQLNCGWHGWLRGGYWENC